MPGIGSVLYAKVNACLYDLFRRHPQLWRTRFLRQVRRRNDKNDRAGRFRKFSESPELGPSNFETCDSERREAAAERTRRTPIRLQHQNCRKHFHLGSHVGNVLTQSESFVNYVAIFAGPTTAHLGGFGNVYPSPAAMLARSVRKSLSKG